MKLLIFILTYNHERYIADVLRDIPDRYKNSDDCEILIIDDTSADRTCQAAHKYAAQSGLKNLVVMRNAQNQGYGGNQKVGYRYAIEKGFDAVAMVHGDGQYTPKVLPELVEAFEKNPLSAGVLGVRFGKNHSPLKGGMPLYKFLGNQILTRVQNWFARTNLSEWHTGYRLYSVRALSMIAFELNTNDFHFDTEIILQLVDRKFPLIEFNIPTKYGDEVCHVNGLAYALNVIKASFCYWLQRYHLFYDIRYHPEFIFKRSEESNFSAQVYLEKFDSQSPHSLVCSDVRLVPEGSSVLDIGCSSGYVAAMLAAKRKCRVVGVDVLPASEVSDTLAEYHRIDLENEPEALSDVFDQNKFDVVLMLDVLEHLAMPELLLLRFYRQKYNSKPQFIFSTGNVAFFVVRLMLLFGYFNYGQKGILDITHKRLFSLRTFRNMMEQTGFIVKQARYFPFPFRALGFPEKLSVVLERVNLFLIKIAPALFSYQVMFVTDPISAPEKTLHESMQSVERLKEGAL